MICSEIIPQLYFLKKNNIDFAADRINFLKVNLSFNGLKIILLLICPLSYLFSLCYNQIFKENQKYKTR